MSRKSKKIKFKTKIPVLIAIFVLLFLALNFNRNSPTHINNNIGEISQLPNDVKTWAEDISKPISFSFRIPVLLYHYVEYVQDKGDTIRISLNTEPHIFESQIKTLKDGGYTFLTPSDIPEFFSGNRALPLRPVVLSFDDGYRDFYTDVFPILKEHKVKAVLYVVPGFLDRPDNLTHIQLKEIADSKLVEIGAHSVYHVYLKDLDPKRLKFEVEQSKVILEKELHLPIVSFAYPYGAFDLKTIEAVKKAGFKTAAATIPGDKISIYNFYFLPRLKPGWISGEALLNFLKKDK